MQGLGLGAECRDWLSLCKGAGQHNNRKADLRGLEVKGPSFLGAVLTTQV